MNILKNFLMSSVFFGLFMVVFFTVINVDIKLGMIAGVVTGTMFGGMLTLFIVIQSNKFKKIGEKLLGNKKIVMQGGANHFIGRESVGGWMWMTEDELIYKSHKYNIQNHELRLNLKDITKVDKNRTLGLVPNGVKITTVNGDVDCFVVFNRKNWIDNILKYMSN